MSLKYNTPAPLKQVIAAVVAMLRRVEVLIFLIDISNPGLARARYAHPETPPELIIILNAFFLVK